MLHATVVSTPEELEQIHALNRQNLKQHLSAAERAAEGFVTIAYPLARLEALHRLAPSVIVKDGAVVAGYALVVVPQAASLLPDLQTLYAQLENIPYRGTLLAHYNFYCMGQICVHRSYRGRGIVPLLYGHHRKLYSPHYRLLVTEIATANTRSLRAHEKIGFEVIATYRDAVDEWKVVVWDWQ